MDIRLTDIRNFLEIARAGIISEATRRLDMAQPSLSESIKRFESDLECKVFYRTKKRNLLNSRRKASTYKSEGCLGKLP